MLRLLAAYGACVGGTNFKGTNAIFRNLGTLLGSELFGFKYLIQILMNQILKAWSSLPTFQLMLTCVVSVTSYCIAREGKTPVHYAIQRKSADMLEALLKLGAPIPTGRIDAVQDDDDGGVVNKEIGLTVWGLVN